MIVYIKGFPLPNNCGACPLRLAWCRERIYMESRPLDCPLIELPPHGRLIDADALSEKMVICSKHIPKDSFEWDLCGEVITQLALAPTIIEAEEGE